jgi:DNA polymerase-3 subunit gamma/tau
MAYLALYRVWRPKRFADVVGQEQTVAALSNAVRSGHLSHAYIFSGPRGTGKTSIAKILARAANCEHPAEGEPCNECASCRDILNGNFMDVIEIDAASNRGIDEIRELREQVNILPAQGKRKVYIIDEVHMLTTEAFNALLKTLEEPPSTVLFVLATTELHKIPPTIISRCQKYGFYRLTAAQIEAQLVRVMEQAGTPAEPAALDMISRRAGGSMRDALSMLDQVLTYEPEALSVQQVREVLGLVDENIVSDLVGKALAGDNSALINLVGEAFRAGVDPRQLLRDTCLYLRDLLGLAYKFQPFTTNFSGEQALKQLAAQAALADPVRVRSALDMMMTSAERLRYADDLQFLLEMAFLDLSRRLNGSGGAEELPAPKTAPAARSKPAAAPRTRPTEDREAGSASSAFWESFLAKVKEVKVPAHAMLSQGHFIGVADDVLYIGYKKGYKFHKEKMEEKVNQDLLCQVLKELTQREMRVEFMFLDDPRYNDLALRKAIELFGADKVQLIE